MAEAPRAVLASLLLLASIGSASCEDAAATGAATAPATGRTVFFGGLDWGRSGFAALGFKRALLGGLDRDGPVVMGTAGYGGEVDRVPGGPLVLRHTVLAGALAGYQWMFPWGAVASFVGPEMSYQTFADGPARDRRSQAKIGARLQGEVFAHPTHDTLLTTNLILGSARGNVWGRVAWGYRLADKVFVGPEASAYATDTYRKEQIGAHVTGLEIGGFSLRLSGGWQREREDRRAGPYLGLSGYISR